jgi:hypothetical protein
VQHITHRGRLCRDASVPAVHLDRPGIPPVAVYASAMTLNPGQRRLAFRLRGLMRRFGLLEALAASLANPP